MLGEQGDLLLYGCDLAASGAGDRLVRRLAQLTGADVAASSDDTFADALSGRRDWILEESFGGISTGYNDLLTGLDWNGRLGGTATYDSNTGQLSIRDASGTLSITGKLDASNTGDVIISGVSGDNAWTQYVSTLKSIDVSGKNYSIHNINLDDPSTAPLPSAYKVNLNADSSDAAITLTGDVNTFGG
jgi:hypothetical protein